MADKAKLFRTGGSQAVRLPRKYRFQGRGEVRIRREGGRIVLEAGKRAWSRRFLELAGSASDFPYPPEIAPAEPAPRLR
jgi:antitoxin VapB